MAKQCSVCGARLLAAEVGEGICEYCRPYSDLPPRPRPTPLSTMSGGSDWQVFRIGLTLIYVFTVTNLLLLLGVGLLLVLDPDALGEVLHELGGVVPGFLVLQGALGITGLGLLLGVPSAARLRGRALGMFGCLLVFVAAPFFLELGVRPTLLTVLAAVLFVCGGAVGFVICFASLLSGAARHLNDAPLAGSIVAFFVSLGLSFLGMILVFFVMNRLLHQTARVGGVRSARETFSCMMGLAVIVSAGFGVWFLVLLGRLRRATL